MEGEPCYLYAEHVFEEAQGERRYRIITVLRPDGHGGLQLADYMEDMGPAKNFRVGPFRIPGGVKELGTDGTIIGFHIDHEVAELRDIAAANHETIWPEYVPDLMTRLERELDNRKKLPTGRSTFGPGGTLIRGT